MTNYYKGFTFAQINTPKYSHIKLLLGWVIYFVLFFLTERLIPESACHVIHCALDDEIPFNENFVIFYCYWYLMVFGSLAYFFFKEVSNFRKLQIFIMSTQAIAMLCYIFYPSIQIGRPEIINDNFLGNVVAFIYSVDTPTGVCPSLHVAYSMGIASVWLKRKKSSKIWKAVVIASCILICISVVFVKQHSVIDVIAALVVSMVAEYIVFERRYEALFRLLKRKTAKLHNFF